MKYVKWLIIGLIVVLIPTTPAYFILKDSHKKQEQEEFTVEVWDKYCNALGGVGFYSYITEKKNKRIHQYVCMNPKAVYSVINIRGDK